MKKKTTKKAVKKTSKVKSKTPKKVQKKTSKKVSKKVIKKTAKIVAKKTTKPKATIKPAKKENLREVPKIGDIAPSFASLDDQGQEIRSSDFLGSKNIVLYFYPKDDTPGCTIEACSFQEHLPNLEDLEAVVIGVSGDSESSHQKFKNKFGLQFPLLVDQDFAIAKSYGAYGPKSMYGKTFMGITRSTFIINKQGKVAACWPSVKVDGHTQQVLDALRSL